MSAERTGQYEIKIKTTADTSGAEKEADALKKVGTAAKDAASELKKVSTGVSADALGEHNVGWQAENLKEVGKGAEKAEEGFKIFGRGAHEAHAALRVLNDAIPGFETMARFLANGLTATMGIAALVIANLKEKLNDLSQALDDLKASDGARGDWAEKLKEKAEESTVAFDVWKDHIDRVVQAEQTLQELTDRDLAQARARLGTESEIGGAQKALAEARLALAEKLGQVTKEQAIKIRLEIDEAAFKQQVEAKVKEIESEINSRGTELDKTEYRQDQLNRNVDSTKTAADAATAVKTKHDAKLAQDKKNLEDAIEEQKKAQEIVDSLEGKGAWGGNYDKSDPQYYELQAAKEKVEAMARLQGGYKHEIAQEENKQPGIDTAAETSKAAYDDAKAKYEEAAKTEHDLNIKLAQLAEDLAAEKAKAAALESLHNATAETNARTAQVGAGETQDEQRRRAESQSGRYPGTDTGSTDSWINYGKGVAARAEANLPGSQQELHATIARLASLLEQHLNIAESQAAALKQTQTDLSNLESRVQVQGALY